MNDAINMARDGLDILSDPFCEWKEKRKMKDVTIISSEVECSSPNGASFNCLCKRNGSNRGGKEEGSKGEENCDMETER